MTDFKIVSLIFMALIVMDAWGDVLDSTGKQVLSHIFEAVQIAVWIALTAIIAREWIEWSDKLIVMYITLRIAIFDVTFNIIRGNKWSYVGTSSLYGKLLIWFSNLPRVREPGHLIWVIRVLVLIWWVTWFWSNGG